MGNPSPDIVMRKAVIGYSVSSTAWYNPPPLVTELDVQLIVGTENPSGGNLLSTVGISFLDNDEGDPLGFCLIQDNQLESSEITLPLQEFDKYMAILRYANPAVLEFFLRPGPEGSIQYDITALRLAGGWGVATPVQRDRRLSPRRGSAARASSA